MSETSLSADVNGQLSRRTGRRKRGSDEKAAALRQALESFPSLPDNALARMDVTAALFSVSHDTIRNWVNAGHFPKPVRYGPNAVGWRVGDLRNKLAEAA